MTLIVETGSGVRGANGYCTVTFVTSHLADRGRSTENGWDSAVLADQEGAIIEATTYIDRQNIFQGFRAVELAGRAAVAQLDFAGQAIAAETVTIGQEVYTFVAALDLFTANDVLIGVDVDTTVENLISAVNRTDGADTTYSIATSANAEAGAQLLEGTTTSILLTARQEGSSGNDITLSETATQVDVAEVFQNGLDGGSQPLESPREALVDRAGRAIAGMPRRLKEATAEYAVRQLVAKLDPDPLVDARGLQVTRVRKKTDVLESEFEYAENQAAVEVKPYPAADRLLEEFTRPAGVIR